MKDFLINNPKLVFKENLTHSILYKSNSYNFHTSKNYYNKTSLFELKSLSKEIGVQSISIKDESNRFGLNSFKVLGSTFAIDKILDKQPKIDTFCTATDGNHGKGLAWAAQNINKKVIVYVPKDTTLERIKEIEKYNANVYQLNLNYEDTCVYAFQESKKNNWCLVQDASWDNYEEIPALIMSGYLTHFKEIECFTNNMTLVEMSQWMPRNLLVSSTSRLISDCGCCTLVTFNKTSDHHSLHTWQAALEVRLEDDEAAADFKDKASAQASALAILKPQGPRQTIIMVWFLLLKNWLCGNNVIMLNILRTHTHFL